MSSSRQRMQKDDRHMKERPLDSSSKTFSLSVSVSPSVPAPISLNARVCMCFAVALCRPDLNLRSQSK